MLMNISADQIISGIGSQSGNVDGNGTLIAASSQATVAPGTNTENFSGDNLAHRVNVSQSGWAVQGGGGLLTVAINAGHVIVVGGAGGIHYTARSGDGEVVYTAADSRNTLTFQDANGDDTIASAGTDAIVFAATGNKSVSITGTAKVVSNSSDNQFAVNGGRAVVTEVGGSDVFDITNGGAVTVTGPDVYLGFQENLGTAAINVSQGRLKSVATIAGGSASGYVWNGAMSITTASGTIGAKINLAAGNFTITSFGSDIIRTGAGNYTIQIHGAAQILEGNPAGRLDVYSQGDQGGVVHGGPGTTVNLYGDSAYTYVAGPAANTVNDFVSGLRILGGAGLLTANVSAGRDVIVGGSGGIALNDTAGGDTIRTASGASDTLRLSGPSTVFAGGNDTITVGDANCWIQASGTATIAGGAGSSTFVLNGRETLTLQSRTTDTVIAERGAVATVTSASALTDISEIAATVSFIDTAVPGTARLTLAGGAASVSAASGGRGLGSDAARQNHVRRAGFGDDRCAIQWQRHDHRNGRECHHRGRQRWHAFHCRVGSGCGAHGRWSGHDNGGQRQLDRVRSINVRQHVQLSRQCRWWCRDHQRLQTWPRPVGVQRFRREPDYQQQRGRSGITVLLANQTELILPGVTYLS